MPRGVFIRTEEHKRKISLKMKGLVRSLETRRKISLAKKGKPPPNIGKKMSIEQKIKIGNAHRGKVVSEETRKKLSEAFSGEKHYRWQGGITVLRERYRNKYEYGKWRRLVLNDCGYKCLNCCSNEKLRVHHIFNFSENVGKRFDRENGVVLCDECHKRFHKEFGRSGNTFYQITKFLCKRV